MERDVITHVVLIAIILISRYQIICLIFIDKHYYGVIFMEICTKHRCFLKPLEYDV